MPGHITWLSFVCSVSKSETLGKIVKKGLPSQGMCTSLDCGRSLKAFKVFYLFVRLVGWLVGFWLGLVWFWFCPVYWSEHMFY